MQFCLASNWTTVLELFFGFLFFFRTYFIDLITMSELVDQHLFVQSTSLNGTKTANPPNSFIYESVHMVLYRTIMAAASSGHLFSESLSDYGALTKEYESKIYEVLLRTEYIAVYR